MPPGFAGEIIVSGEAAGLSMATYALDESKAPDGVGSGISTFREDAAGYDLAGAAVGEPGQAGLTVPVDVPRDDELVVAYTCEGLPRGYNVHIGVVGEPGYFDSNGCGFNGGFDPGGTADIGLSGPWAPDSDLRIWVQRGGETVADGELPDLRLGFAAYTPTGEDVVAAGHAFPEVIEHGGKVWERATLAEAGGGELPQLTVPDEGQHVVTDWVVASRQTPYALSLDGSATDQEWMSGIKASGSGAILVQPGQDVGLEIRGDEADVQQSALALYRRVD